MATSKKDEFSGSEIALAELMKALAHPARLSILKLLAARDTCICGELVDELPLSQSTVSQHLKALKDAGLVQGEIDGPKVCYCIDPEGLDRLADSFSQFMKSVNVRSNKTKKCC